jgi:hypothetical protein
MFFAHVILSAHPLVPNTIISASLWLAINTPASGLTTSIDFIEFAGKYNKK